MTNGNELFAELGRYNSEYRRLKEPAGDFSTALLNIGPDYYFTNLHGINDDNSSSNKNIRIYACRMFNVFLFTSPKRIY